MATTIITGRDCTLTIATVNYADQITNAELNLEGDQQEYDTLSDTAYKTLKTTGTLSLEILQDWGAATSLCEELWNAAKDDPDTGIAFSLVANTGATFTGFVFPKYPAVGGAAVDALTTTVELVVVDGDVTLA
jgi:hypothetical protein